MASISYKQILRHRVLDDMLKAVQPASKWKLLIVDSASAKLLNAICKSHEILEENVTLIEELFRKRQAFPNYEAIYFITPNERSIDRLVSDFTSDKPLYLAAHIFFLSCKRDAACFDRFQFKTTNRILSWIYFLLLTFIRS